MNIRLELSLYDFEDARAACTAFLEIIMKREVDSLSFEVQDDEGGAWREVLGVALPALPESK